MTFDLYTKIVLTVIAGALCAIVDRPLSNQPQLSEQNALTALSIRALSRSAET